jgi:hypothetical protein
MSQGETEQGAGTAGTSAGRTLFAVLGGAVAWSLHFLGSYAVVAIGCVAGWASTLWIVIVGTLALAALALWSTVVAWRDWRRSAGDQPWDTALSEPKGWYAWLMTVGALMGITSVFTILLEGFGTLMLPLCGWNVR